MSRIALHLASALVACALAASAHAQTPTPAAAAIAPAAPGIALGVDSGSVLVSTGGEFGQASSGQPIAPGHRVLVAEGGRASLTYANGCAKSLATAGVYTVSADCDSTRPAGGLSTGAKLGIGASVAAIAAVAGGGGSDRDTPPVSR
ncbi:hypothetical protein H5368_04295 [Luteimonas sp. MC1782]|uniref:hypothetical protein n=1 Tax=Luteimonas sp. MC1782 TaxID=2760305 RepID=UPI0016011B28|nr:hypothetical protein [Luteimonas sp. MC1782]MBB1472245.1 hypothetical protein [Luteimonas sp. MC1782]